MNKRPKQIAGLFSAIVLLISVSGCSLFKEDDCGCPSFGEKDGINKDGKTIQANK